jgi:dienelactone hydrolase
MARRTRVTFKSQGSECAGYLYWPENLSGKSPCVVLCNGFSGTMDWVLPQFAERFAAEGMTALIFDYRYFGESAGRPRQLISVKRQRQDIRAALRFARRHAQLDSKRIALWGTSLGGGHVIDVASRDKDLKAVVAQVPGIDMVRKDARALIVIPTGTIVKLLAAAVWDGLRGALGLSPYYVKVAGKPGDLAIFTDPALQPRFEAVERGSATWRNEFTPRFYLAPPRYRDGTAERIKMPLFVCVAEKEVYANPKFQAWVGQQAPKGEVRHYPGAHFDFYHDLFEDVVRDQVAFLCDAFAHG